MQQSIQSASLYNKLEYLEQEHDELDTDLQDPANQTNLDHLTIIRLKKHKLKLKDEIEAIRKEK